MSEPIIIKNRYQLGSRVKAEATGIIYEGIDLTSKVPVHIKHYHPELLTSAVVEKLQESLYRLAAVRHDTILVPVDHSFERKNFFVIQEIIPDEETVADILKKLKAFTLDTALFVIKETATALSYLHRKKICHGNLTADNVCIAKDGSILIKNAVCDAVINHASIKHGRVLGSPCYKAPEQLSAQPTKPQSDIWALGVLLYHMLTGELPFKEHSDTQGMLRATAPSPVLPTLRNPKIPKYLEDLIMVCLQEDADLRPHSTADLLEQLASKKVRVRVADIEMVAKKQKPARVPVTVASARGPQGPQRPTQRPPQRSGSSGSGGHNFPGQVGSFINDIRERVLPQPVVEKIKTVPQELPRQIKTMAEKFDELIEQRPKRQGLFKRPRTLIQKVLVYGTVVFCVGVITALSQALFLGYFTSIPEIELPDLRGLPTQQAYDILESKGLKGITAGEMVNAQVPADHVISQKPEAGRIVKKDRVINLFVSKGVGETKVPEITGRDLDQVKALLARSSLGLEISQYVYSSTIQKNIIIKQTPEPDVVVQKNSTVNAVVSNGYPVTLVLRDRSEQNCVVDATVAVPADWETQQIKLQLSDARGTRTVIDQSFAPGQQKKVQLVAEEKAFIEVYYNGQIALKQSFEELSGTAESKP